LKTIEELLADMQTITDAAETRSLTEDEVTRYEALETELKAAQKTQELRARQAAYVAPNASLAAGVHVATAKADNTLERAFDAYLRTGHENADLQELRAQSVGTPSAGGFTVPETFVNKLIEVRKTFGGIQSVAETITTDSGERLRFPVLDDTANTGVLVDELTAPASNGADLVFTEVELTAHRYTAPGDSNNPLRVSRELLQDSAFDVQSVIARKLGERVERAIALDLAKGTGTNEPKGIVNGTAKTNVTLTYDSLIDAIHSVDIAYRNDAVWLFSDATVAMIEKLKDEAERPLINTATDGINVARTSMTLLGYPVVVVNEFDAYAATGSKKFGAFGSIREGYLVRRVSGAELIVNPYSAAASGAVEFTLHVRADATVQNTAAFRVLQSPAS